MHNTLMPHEKKKVVSANTRGSMLPYYVQAAHNVLSNVCVQLKISLHYVVLNVNENF